ncbi:MAG: hypothetical protein OEM59_03455 [Rhodospirillales bacterium]|nr:hypothetical protein [Rhodospirillales bacterium]
MDAQETVFEGQCYSQKLMNWNSKYLIWRVKSICDTAMRMPHAQLVNVKDPLETRTVSCRTLINRAYYELVESGVQERTQEKPLPPSGARRAA